MTSIRRSDEPYISPISQDPESPVSSQKPALKSVPPPPANRLEAHKAPQPGPRPVDADLVNAATDLVKGCVHPGIFEEAKPERAQQALSRLPPREFSAVLGKLEESGSLDRFLSQLSPEQKTAFLDTAVRKGALQTERAKPAQGPLDPPSTPAAYAIPANAPLGLAKAANQFNLEAAGNFYGAQQQYLNRYEAAARGCTSGAELRALGEPAKLGHPSNPIDASHPKYPALQREWIDAHRMPDAERVHKTVSDRLSDFMGEGRAGSFFVEGKVDVEGVQKMASLDASGRIAENGKASGKAAGKASLPNGAMIGLDSKGTATIGVHGGGNSVALEGGKLVVALKEDELNAKLELEAGANGKFSKVKAQVAGSGLTWEENARARVDVSLLGKAGGYGFYDSTKGEFGGGVKGKIKSGQDTVSFSAGLGMQGLSEANARHAFNGVGVWSTPPELTAGKEWKELSAATQDGYRRLGWTAQEWTAKAISSRA
jgi:hypothetical protein